MTFASHNIAVFPFSTAVVRITQGRVMSGLGHREDLEDVSFFPPNLYPHIEKLTETQRSWLDFVLAVGNSF